MPINEHDEVVFAITEQLTEPIDLTQEIGRLIERSKNRLDEEGVERQDVYPEMSSDEEAMKITLTVYRRQHQKEDHNGTP